MARTSNPLRSFAPAAVLAAATVVLLLAGSPPVYPDDTDLLRFDTRKPYVFILLDTSGSMAQTPQGQWLQANGDDPRSKLYSAKKVLYEVFENVNDVHFGFATFNQDEVRAASKHWLYYTEEAALGAWPLSYPTPDPGGPTQLDADDFAVTSKQGDLLTLGAHFPGSSGRAGACRAPLAWNGNPNHDDREKLDRFAKLDSGTGTTVHWLSDANRVYRLVVTRPGNKPDGNPNAALGKDDMHVVFDLARVEKSGNTQLCGVDDDAALGNDATFDQTYPSHNVKLRLFTEFLIADDPAAAEPIGGFWSSRDLFVDSNCADPHPHSGGGWEGNYDGGAVSNPNDPACQSESAPLTCFNLKRPTTIDPDFSTWRAMDLGDLMPFDWRTEKKAELLARLAPGTTESGQRDFGIAGYFEDTADLVTGSLPLANTNERPLVASGLSPLGKAIGDFRCWYVGEGNKCKDGPFDTNGWAKVAEQNDESWGCRKPFLIVISDGDDNCVGPNPCSETANLKNKADTPTWVIAYGADCAKAGNPLHCMARNGGTQEPICPDSPQRLKDTLKAILGQIRQQSRAFASAAVPSVQAIVDDKIFLSSFTPLNDQPTWDGHLNSFLKPLPLNTTTRSPRTDAGAKCTTKPVDQLSECHLWDAGEVLEGMLSPGGGENQRRVFYSRETTSGTWAEARQLFETTSVATPAAVKHDLWRGLDVDPASENDMQVQANAIINETYALKEFTTTIIDPVTGTPVAQTVRWVLGDIFHSNPLVVGGPANTRFFAGDVPGYRAFAEKHRLRRKLVLVGANDGMLHAFDAGIYRASPHDDEFTSKTIDDEFDNGSGREVFAYIPRAALPAVRKYAEGVLREDLWAVDGSVTAADAFIDPKHTGTPDPARREWRTVLVGGLREGGRAYYALDITQPDTLDGDNVPEPASGSVRYLPSCTALAGGLPAGCGRVPYPAALWEFDDTVVDAVTGERVAFDEDPEDLDVPKDGELDSNGPDLGDAWSTPNLGRIRLKEGSATVDKYVVIFGGGFDSFNKSAPKRGRWLYMLDVETGKPIYKRLLEDGPAPSEPAAVDTDQDGYLDRIYIGTLGGTIYRVDLTPDPSTGEFPELVPQQARGENGAFYDVERVPANVWVPRAIFKTSSPAGVLPEIDGRPIYYRPSVIFVAELGRYALSWGTGNRENLWQEDKQDGRFYVWLDDSADLSDAQLPVTESSLARITVTASATAERFLVAENRSLGARGWYLVLNEEERVITDAFALSGVSFFSTYNPVTCQGTIDPVTNTCNEVRDDDCAKGGKSRVFIVNTLNANSFMTEVGTSIPTRFFDVHTFVTNPYTEQGQTKNPGATGGGVTADDLDERLSNIMESLKQLFPGNCKFANYRVDIKTVNADTGVVFIAPVPVCIVEKNWREF